MARAGAKVRQGARKPRTGRFHGKEERTPIIRSDPVPADWFPRRGSICQLCRSGSLCGSRPQPAGSSLRAHVQPLRQRDPGVQPHRIEAQSGGQHQTADHQPVTPCARKPYCCMHVGVLLWPEPRWHCRTREGRAGAAPAAAFGPVVAKGGQHAHEKKPLASEGQATTRGRTTVTAVASRDRCRPGPHPARFLSRRVRGRLPPRQTDRVWTDDGTWRASFRRSRPTGPAAGRPAPGRCAAARSRAVRRGGRVRCGGCP